MSNIVCSTPYSKPPPASQIEALHATYVRALRALFAVIHNHMLTKGGAGRLFRVFYSSRASFGDFVVKHRGEDDLLTVSHFTDRGASRDVHEGAARFKGFTRELSEVSRG